jgi:hypothetical protein
MIKVKGEPCFLFGEVLASDLGSAGVEANFGMVDVDSEGWEGSKTIPVGSIREAANLFVIFGSRGD